MKPTWRYILTGLLLTLTMACSSSKDAPEPDPDPDPEIPEFPRTLKLKGTRIGEFKLYVGSPAGGKEAAVDGLTPESFWKGRLSSVPPTALWLKDESYMARIPTNTSGDAYKYTFRGDSLFRFNINLGDWVWSAWGNKDKLTYHIGYYIYVIRSSGSAITYGVGQENEWYKPQESFYQWPPVNMKDKRDTLAWCNMEYIFEYEKPDEP